ncbi:putative calcium-binding protein [Cardamine amara subsp. amara]|uniref:Calcium-binding protein n=1 Tax=Cardamine amara subsp. amara TaxID=228776 RepID=A0ABD1BSY4_CARAN
MQSHQHRSRLSLILRSRFIPSFSSPLSLIVVVAAIPLPIYFSGILSSLSGRTNNKAVSVMRLNSNLASMVEPNISCTTFNILAPIYKRIDKQNHSIRESDFGALWFDRNQRILDMLLHERSSVICLQELWVGNKELVKMYHERLGSAGYTIFELARTNGRGDGLLTAIHKDYFKLVNYRELLFNDFGDRVAQLLHVKSVIPFPLNGKQDVQQEVIIVNTHLLFPHHSSLSIVRLHQVYKILEYLEAYLKENKLNHMPIILCGDWNGSKRGHVYKFLRSQGFVSSYDDAHQYTDSDAHRWVSHRNHRGNICGVDFIWLCNPSDSRKPLRTSWVEAVFSIIKYQLQKASIAEDDSFAFLGANNHSDSLTYPDFCQALQKLNLTGMPHGLSFQETKELWVRADLDGNGVFDYEELKKIWNMTMVNQPGNCKESVMESKKDEGEEAIGLKVNKAVLFPQEAERGLWPENYNLSDHACLTVQFSPVKMLCS